MDGPFIFIVKDVSIVGMDKFTNFSFFKLIFSSQVNSFLPRKYTWGETVRNNLK